MRASVRRKRGTGARAGGVLLEFAIALPVLLIVVLATMELGLLFFVRHAMLNSARDAARSYAIGEFDAAGTAALASQRLQGINVGFTITTSPDADTGADRWVQIVAPIDGAVLNDPLNLFADDYITVRVTMRRED